MGGINVRSQSLPLAGQPSTFKGAIHYKKQRSRVHAYILDGALLQMDRGGRGVEYSRRTNEVAGLKTERCGRQNERNKY